jgi:2',3'-cyclic-nucleotide 2'-phosphodiesterase/3'-nucleotidase
MTGVSRRTFITGSAAAAVLAGVGFNNTAEAAAIGNDGQTYRLTVMGTTDLHGNVFNWDYFKNAEYDDSAHNDIGLAKVSSLVNALRATRGDDNTLLIDAGDTIQGTPLAYYYAKINPISRKVIHPMAAAMNAMEYDAAALGNHEFTTAYRCSGPMNGSSTSRCSGRMPWTPGRSVRPSSPTRSSWFAPRRPARSRSASSV